MAEEKTIRLNKVAKEFSKPIQTLIAHLDKKGFGSEFDANSKITLKQVETIASDFGISLKGSHIVELFNTTPKTVEHTVSHKTATPQEAVENKAKTVKTAASATETKVIEKTNAPVVNKETAVKEIPAQKTTEVKHVENKAAETKIDAKVEVSAEVKTEAEPKKEEVNKTEVKTEVKEGTTTKEPETISGRTIGPKILGKIDLPEQKKGDRYSNPFSSNKDKRNNKDSKDSKDRNKDKIQTQTQTKQTGQGGQVHGEKKQETRTNDNNRNDRNRDKNRNEQQKDKDKTNLKIAEKPIDEIVTPKLPENEAIPEPELEVIKAKGDQLKGLTILGNIQLPVADKGRKKDSGASNNNDEKRKKRKRKRKEGDRVASSDTKPNSTTNQTVTATTNNQTTQNNTTQNKSNNNNQHRNNRNNNTNSNVPPNNNSRPITVVNQGQNRSNNTGGNNNTGTNNSQNRNNNNRNNRKQTAPVSASDVKSQIKQTFSAMSGGKGKSAKRTRGKRENQEGEATEETTVLRVTEFISTSELANLMNTPVSDVISAALGMGMFISINQRLDAEAITFMTTEFGFDVEFISLTEEDAAEVEEVIVENLRPRAPIVTIMGHVDHGKTSLLDYIRTANVMASESGGITQHIGAYDVLTESGQRVVFLDTPGHEAFTAMRARGAKVTDIVIIVVAADDSVMPQTKEAINHARVAGVPMIIAINKVDKETADVEKIKKELAQENVLVESWGGKFQDQEISAKKGTGIADLLEKILLEAEILELKADPIKKATGTVIEATLDKGKGYVTTVLVQTGTLKVGDAVLAGSHYGKIKAMMDHRGKRLKVAPPATPVQILGLDGAPQAGDIFKVMENERDAREVAAKREQILRAQSVRATKGMTLEEIGRRRALSSFQELKLIVKGDVDGSVEALSDSLLKLSTEEVQVNILHKAVGPISETDIMLASTSDAIIIAFQVRPSPKAKLAAEQEKVQIKQYSVIYKAIEEVKDAMEGMLAPKIEESIVGNVEVRDVFKITKVGTVAGCYVTDGYIKRNNKIRLIRDGIVAFEGEISALKRFKDDVSEVKHNYECGISLKNFHDIKVGDVIESYEEKEIKRTL